MKPTETLNANALDSIEKRLAVIEDFLEIYRLENPLEANSLLGLITEAENATISLLNGNIQLDCERLEERLSARQATLLDLVGTRFSLLEARLAAIEGRLTLENRP